MPHIKCFVLNCTRTFDSATQYIHHLLQDHRVPRDYRFPCTFGGCPSVFTKFCSYKRHVLNHDIVLNADDTNSQPSGSGICTLKSSTNESIKGDEKIGSEDNQSVGEKDGVLESLTAINTASINFSLDLHRRNNLTRNDVRSVQDSTQQLYSMIANQIQRIPLQCDADTQFKLNSLLEKMMTMFNFINTDFKLFKVLQNRNIFKLPDVVIVEKTNVKKVQIGPHDDLEIDNDKQYIAIMDIEFQLKSYFECRDVLKQTLMFMSKLENSSKIKNFVNGARWNTVKQKYPNDIVIPLSFYADEYEINDVLSSHNKKDVICGLYYNCLITPDEYRSRLSNIFIAGAIKKVAISEIGINKLISKVIARFVHLEENGLYVTVDGENHFLRFALVLCQGDNLGIHSLHMFCGGFNANYYCRFCRRCKDMLQNDTDEYKEELRNAQNYAVDIATNNQKETGLKGESEFNTLPSFHVTENLSVDAMHDIFSTGICKYGFTNALNYFIYEKQYFNRQQLNTRRRAVSKVALDQSLARMPDIDEFFDTNRKSKSVKLRTTSSEMRSFCHYFTFIVGPMVKHDDPVWEFVKVLVRLVELSLFPSFSDTDIAKLRTLASQHHKLYQELFSESLKPKHHFILHYGTVIEQSGPVVKQMCFRFEAKHKQFKQYAHAITSRKNICYTLCVKASLQFSYDLLNETFFNSTKEAKFSETDFRRKPYFDKLVGSHDINLEKTILFASSSYINGIMYKHGLFVTYTNQDVTELLEIVEILKIDSITYIVGQLWQCGVFNEHLLACEAQVCTQLFQIIKLADLDGPPLMIHNIDNRMYFRKRYDFTEEDSDI